MPGVLPPNVQQEPGTKVRLFDSPVVLPSGLHVGGDVLPVALSVTNWSVIVVPALNWASPPVVSPVTLKSAYVQFGAKSRRLVFVAACTWPGPVATMTVSVAPPAIPVTLMFTRFEIGWAEIPAALGAW
jgi:hypothetical protein